MPFLAQEHLAIPTKDLISWCYDNRASFDQDKPVSKSCKNREIILKELYQIYIDAANPSQSISATQAYQYIRQLVAGFHAAGLKQGDVVCIHSFNNVCSLERLYFSTDC
jgi:4-coumarate--CoA ligase